MLGSPSKPEDEGCWFQLTGQEGEAERLRGMNFTKDTRSSMVLSRFEPRSIRVSCPHSLPFTYRILSPNTHFISK